MRRDVSQAESHCLSAGNASRGIFQAGLNAAQRRDGGIPVVAASHLCRGALATLSGRRGPSCHRRPCAH